jgi:hypothetical protein
VDTASTRRRERDPDERHATRLLPLFDPGHEIETTVELAPVGPDCKAWACFSTYFLRIDTILTTGIKWMYSHPALPCYQEQQQRVTKGFQELRGGIRMLSLAIQTGDDWRAKVARRKIRATELIFQNLPVQTCPA